MKNYVKLSLSKSIQYITKRFNQSGIETNNQTAQQKEKTDSLKVSILIPTHRPDSELNNEDAFTLKEKIAKAEKQLLQRAEKSTASNIIKNMYRAEKNIDYDNNWESLILYATDDFCSTIRLPIKLKPVILIDPHFDVRPLYKSLQQVKNYLIITVSQQKIRLIQAQNGMALEEFNNEDFPFDNTDYYTVYPKRLKQDIFTDSLVKEFFHVANRKLKKYAPEYPFPIVLAGDVKSTAYYRELMNDDSRVICNIKGNYDDVPINKIVKKIAPLVKEYAESEQRRHIRDIEKADSQGIATWNIQEIYDLAREGNVDTLYIGNNFSLKGTIKDNKIDSNPKDKKSAHELTLDIIELINLHKGNIIFMEDKLIQKWHNIVLIKHH